LRGDYPQYQHVPAALKIRKARAFHEVSFLRGFRAARSIRVHKLKEEAILIFVIRKGVLAFTAICAKLATGLRM